MHVQVAGLAKSVQQKKAELDAELAAVQSEQLVLPHQALPQHSSDDLHLSDPVEPELPAVPGERRASVSSAKDLWPGLDTSTPSGVRICYAVCATPWCCENNPGACLEKGGGSLCKLLVLWPFVQQPGMGLDVAATDPGACKEAIASESTPATHQQQPTS